MPTSPKPPGSPTDAVNIPAAGLSGSSLTPHQAELLRYIRRFQLTYRYSPSLRNLAVAYGLRSKNGVAKMVHILERKGFLERGPGGEILFPRAMLDPNYHR